MPDAMTFDDAGNMLYQQVYVPAFFQKLAELGHRDITPERGESLLRQSHALRQWRAIEMTKQAAAQGDPMLLAEQRLFEQLSQHGIQNPNQVDGLNKFASEVAMARPDLVQAAIEYQNGYAKQMLANPA